MPSEYEQPTDKQDGGRDKSIDDVGDKPLDDLAQQSLAAAAGDLGERWLCREKHTEQRDDGVPITSVSHGPLLGCWV